MSNVFSHDSLDVKRHFLSIAREHLDKSNAEKSDDLSLAYELSAALLYMNVADYLAEYLVKGIVRLSEQAVGEYYHGTISVRQKRLDDLNIGKCIKILKEYDFPRREDILQKLDLVNKARNKVAHQILKISANELAVIDQAVRDLRDSSEELINIIDQVQLGMPPKNLYDSLGSH